MILLIIVALVLCHPFVLLANDVVVILVARLLAVLFALLFLFVLFVLLVRGLRFALFLSYVVVKQQRR